MSWWKNLKGKVLFNEPLAPRTTYGIGGKAAFFIEPRDTQDLKTAVLALKKEGIRFFIIGAGSNLLIKDNALEAAVISLSSPHFKKVFFLDEMVEAGAGVMLVSLIKSCADKGLSGLEFLTGVPGTLGGALCMNAGQAKEGYSISDVVESVTVMDDKAAIKKMPRSKIKFSYRHSSLSRYIILGVGLRLQGQDKEKIKEEIRKYAVYRKGSQGAAARSAGCVFKNPEGDSAGRLIDACGLKGRRAGGAVISTEHANFILNKGRASARDVLTLMRLVKKEVKDKFGIILREEVKIWS